MTRSSEPSAVYVRLCDLRLPISAALLRTAAMSRDYVYPWRVFVQTEEGYGSPCWRSAIQLSIGRSAPAVSRRIRTEALDRSRSAGAILARNESTPWYAAICDYLCFGSSGSRYYHRDSIRYAFDMYCINIGRRTGTRPLSIYSTKLTVFPRNSMCRAIADVRIGGNASA